MFEASPARPYLKNGKKGEGRLERRFVSKMLAMNVIPSATERAGNVPHICHPSVGEVETSRFSGVQLPTAVSSMPL